MDALVQTLVVVLIIAAALGYVGRRAWRAVRPRKAAGCDAACGCGDAASDGDDWAKS